MARKSLRPYLNQIRAWSREGRTDAWVAHQLEVTVQEIQQFKRQNGLTEGPEEGAGPAPALAEELDMRAADEALIAAELEAAERAGVIGAAAAEEEAATGATYAPEEGEGGAAEASEEGGESEEEGQGARSGARGRRRARRGGARRSNVAPGRLEGTFDHGEEGYGLWLDPAVRDNPVYAEHWAGHRPIEVLIEEDQIVIRRLSEESTEQ
ncbi:MAG TPA: hypothetical protein VKU89_05650 [Solirubrobacteraceae bacterium]|nr:hypothetical protein [Solirubrobacteraceae bacterium]